MPPASSPTSTSPPTSALNRSTASTQNMKSQRSILGFFQKSSPSTPSAARGAEPASSPAQRASEARGAHASSVKSAKSRPGRESSLDVPEVPSSDFAEVDEVSGLTSRDENGGKGFSSPSRRAKKQVNYVESGSEGEDDDEQIFRPRKKNNVRNGAKRRKPSPEDDGDFEQSREADEYSDDDMDDFVVADDSEEDVKPSKKRKRPLAQPSYKSSSLPPPPAKDEDPDMGIDVPETSAGTAMKWTFDPDNLEPRKERTPIESKTPSTITKAHLKEPEERYPWLASVRDMDGHSPGNPEYDPRSIYIPPLAWKGFSPFEKQYWEIKQKFWDIVVFFKKGKFYELYENDATVGHQLFDLKLTDRVNMRMVGVLEMSLDHWANQFVAKGYKIARVDQSESALGKEMRERDGKKGGGKEDKVIKRELSCVLTAGTLVEGGMLQDDMSTYCVAVKEAIIDERPAFGSCQRMQSTTKPAETRDWPAST